MEPTTPTAPTRMRLMYIILSIPGSNVFSVNVRGDRIVDDLKKEIKNEDDSNARVPSGKFPHSISSHNR